MSTADATAAAAAEPAGPGGFLGWIERVGNRVPHPVVLFVVLIAVVVVLSTALDIANVKTTFETVKAPAVPTEEIYDGGSVEPSERGPVEAPSDEAYKTVTETAAVKGLLSGDGVRFMFTSVVDNIQGFAAIAVILVAMLGVGLAEEAGLIAALIRRLVKVASAGTLTFVIVLLGVVSSIASDAGYLVLIPLGAAAFVSVGRHPLAGIAAAFAGVSAGFGVNLLITPTDGVITQITNEAAEAVDPGSTLDLTANLFFGIGSTIFITIVMTLITSRLIERRLGTFTPDPDTSAAQEEQDIPAPEREAAGIRAAGLAALGAIVVIVLLTAIPGAPLQNPETGEVIGDSPFMDSLIVLITIIFFAAGWAYGRAAGTIKDTGAAIASITKTYGGLAGLLLLLVLIAQFIAYFTFTNMAQVAAVSLGDLLEQMDLGATLLLVGIIIVTTIVNLLLPSVIAKWAILAPIFVPLMIRLGIPPQTTLAAYRIGDSPTNVITPLMVYFPFIVLICQRYSKSAGIGTVISMMLPYALILSVAWTAFFIVWYLIGIPLGPGFPV